MRVINMKKYLISILLLVWATQALSQVLPANSAERKQLKAMGYDLDTEAAGDLWTVASNGISKIVVSRNKDRLVMSRYFTRRVVNDKDEYELLKIINQINSDLSYQTLLKEDSVAVNLYDYGVYDPKTFAKMVRMIEKADAMFNYNDKLLKLVND